MPLANPIKFTLVSLGCAKNQVDSEALIAFLEGEGALWVAEPAEADWVLVNSCGFIAEAKEESIRTTLELKAGLPGKRVLMLGCLVERYGEELRRELTEIDGFCGTLRSAGFRGVLAALEEGAAGGEAAAGRRPPRRPPRSRPSRRPSEPAPPASAKARRHSRPCHACSPTRAAPSSRSPRGATTAARTAPSR